MFTTTPASLLVAFIPADDDARHRTATVYSPTVHACHDALAA